MSSGAGEEAPVVDVILARRAGIRLGDFHERHFEQALSRRGRRGAVAEAEGKALLLDDHLRESLADQAERPFLGDNAALQVEVALCGQLLRSGLFGGVAREALKGFFWVAVCVRSGGCGQGEVGARGEFTHYSSSCGEWCPLWAGKA